MKSIPCSQCGKPVSSPVPDGTVIRAYVMCPECIKLEEDLEEKLAAAIKEHVKEKEELLQQLVQHDAARDAAIKELGEAKRKLGRLENKIFGYIDLTNKCMQAIRDVLLPEE